MIVANAAATTPGIFPVVEFVIFNRRRQIVEDRLRDVRLVGGGAYLDQLHATAETLTAGAFAGNILLKDFERFALLTFAQGLQSRGISICRLSGPSRTCAIGAWFEARRGCSPAAVAGSAGRLRQRHEPSARFGVGSRSLIHQCGIEQLRNVGDKGLESRTNRAGDRLIATAQSIASFHHKALQIKPCAAARQRHGAFGGFEQLLVLLIDQQPFQMPAKIGRRSFQPGGIGQIDSRAQLSPTQPAQHQIGGRTGWFAPPQKRRCLCHLANCIDPVCGLGRAFERNGTESSWSWFGTAEERVSGEIFKWKNLASFKNWVDQGTAFANPDYRANWSGLMNDDKAAGIVRVTNDVKTPGLKLWTFGPQGLNIDVNDSAVWVRPTIEMWHGITPEFWMRGSMAANEVRQWKQTFFPTRGPEGDHRRQRERRALPDERQMESRARTPCSPLPRR